MGQPKHTGPAPSERALFQVWDRIEEERVQRGEKAATQLAQRALQAVQPPKEKETKDASRATHE